MSSIYGNLFKISTWGESHGRAVGVVVDGCPAGLAISEKEIQKDLDRRRPGQSKFTTKRRESDRIEILSGIFQGKTTGTPIFLIVANKDQRSRDYREMKRLYRPSHADFTYDAKYGFRDYRGGGRGSARETIGRVAAGAIARKVLKKACGMEIIAYVAQAGGENCDIDPLSVSISRVEKSPVRCPDPAAGRRMEKAILDARKQGDSIGGIIQLVVKNVPAGLGEPVFHRVEAELAHALLSIPATKGFEIGSGFSGTRMKGSNHNDEFIVKDGKIQTVTNNSGGVQGGITNGMPVLCRVAFKPVATISKLQKTVTSKGEGAVLKARGRHDPCVLPRAVVIVETMAAMVMVNLYMEQNSRRNIFS
jgi:chorismate synthase